MVKKEGLKHTRGYLNAIDIRAIKRELDNHPPMLFDIIWYEGVSPEYVVSPTHIET